MAPRYFIGQDFGAADGLVSYSPHWALAFVRYQTAITYDPTSHSSISKDPSVAYAERDETNPLVIDDSGDCVNVTVSADKSSHTMTLQAALMDSGVKYTNEILPGDWVVAFMVYSANELKLLVRDLKARVEVNTWDSGLKFVGRVESLQKQVVVSPDGRMRSAYSLNCVAFKELDSTVMYYPQLAFNDASAVVSMERFSPMISGMIRGEESNEYGALDPNRLIPTIMTTIFGKGAWAGEGVGGKDLSPNQAYIVPNTVCKWFGVTTSKGKFSDLMHVLIGVQKFSATVASNLTAPKTPGRLFWPDTSDKKGEGNSIRCSFPLSGNFPATEVPPTTTTAWSFLSNYVAAPVNEAIVTLRPDREGNIFPFLSVRQTPYTSEVGKQFKLEDFQAEQTLTEAYNGGQTSPAGLEAINTAVAGGVVRSANPFSRVPTTRFLELPRWVVPDVLMTESSFGRSDGLRQNLVFVYGSGPGVAVNEYDQFINSPPVTDDLDILRNGIRPYMPSVNCFLMDALMVPLDWRELMADIVMGQHLTLSGTLATYGIRSPVAPGDNLEFQGVIYHIQSVTHSCSIAEDGMRSWTTRFALSRGVVDGSEKDWQGMEGAPSERDASFPNINSTDKEGPPVGVTKD